MEDPILVYYVYNRLVRKQTKTDTQVFFKRNQTLHHGMTDEQIIKWIEDNPKKAEPMIHTKLKHIVGTNSYWSSKYSRLKIAVD